LTPIVSAPLLPAALADWISVVAVTAHRAFDDGEVTEIEESDPQAKEDNRLTMPAVKTVRESYVNRRKQWPPIQAWRAMARLARKLQTERQNETAASPVR
jgi:hypothetical protein